MDLLKQTLKVSAIGALTATLAFGVMSAKAETLNPTITATVNNAIGWAETQALGFGTFVAINDATDTSTIVMDTGGTATVNNPGNARIVEITAGTQGIFDVTGAAPNTSLTLTLPATAVTLTCPTCSGTQEDFSVDTFTSSPLVGSVTTSAAGAVTINVGATLHTLNSSAVYEDGAYTGTYAISIDY